MTSGRDGHGRAALSAPDRTSEAVDIDDRIAPELRPVTLREQVIWMVFDVVLLVCFVALLVEDRLV